MSEAPALSCEPWAFRPEEPAALPGSAAAAGAEPCSESQVAQASLEEAWASAEQWPPVPEAEPSRAPGPPHLPGPPRSRAYNSAEQSKAAAGPPPAHAKAQAQAQAQAHGPTCDGGAACVVLRRVRAEAETSPEPRPRPGAPSRQASRVRAAADPVRAWAYVSAGGGASAVADRAWPQGEA